MSDCFLCARLTESAATAEKRAEDAAAAAAKAEEARTKAKKVFRQASRLLFLDVMRALHGPPFLVVPHVAPRPRAGAERTDRFALVELE